MKITKDLIGKKVRSAIWPTEQYVTIEWVKGYAFAGTYESGDPFTSVHGDRDCYEMYPAKPKKPSESIRHLAMTEKAILPPDRALIESIIQVLDEQWEAGK